MLSLPPSVRIFLCRVPTDMRCSFDSLALMVEQVIGADPYSGHLFVFRNRRGDRVKILYWSRDGYALWYKRLEKGVFRFASKGCDDGELSAVELAMALDGVDIRETTQRRRFSREKV